MSQNLQLRLVFLKLAFVNIDTIIVIGELSLNSFVEKDLLAALMLFINSLMASLNFEVSFFLCCLQREAVEALIQELPKFRLKAVPTDCSECPICLEEFHVGNEVRKYASLQRFL